MVDILNFNNDFFYPVNSMGLERLIIFPDGEFKRTGLPNSSVWVYDYSKHKYDPDLLGPDIGCGIAAFKIPAIDFKKSADKIAEYLKGKNILGRGNHFVDLCRNISSQYSADDSDQDILLLHTDGKQGDCSSPETLDAAIKKINKSESFREELGHKIADIIGVQAIRIGDWTHNSVEQEGGNLIYRKGVIKVQPDKINILPVHMGYGILVYTVSENNLPPESSMPHGTGRKAPLSVLKGSIEDVRKLRESVYVPELIPDSSLKSEHPKCYNSHAKIFDSLSEFMICLGHIEISAYVGKI